MHFGSPTAAKRLHQLLDKRRLRLIVSLSALALLAVLRRVRRAVQASRNVGIRVLKLCLSRCCRRGIQAPALALRRHAA